MNDCQRDINSLKTDIDEKLDKKFIVKGSLGRSKTFSKEATIEKAYPDFFLIKFDDSNRNVSYSYKDVLTKIIEVDVVDGNGGFSPLIQHTPVVEM